jgi:hypothetical protein
LSFETKQQGRSEEEVTKKKGSLDICFLIGMRLQQQEGIQNGAIWTVHSCKPDCRMGRVIASPNPMPSFLRVSLHVHCIDVRHWIYICWDQVDRF